MRKRIHLSAACALLPLLACSDATITEHGPLTPEEGGRAGWVSGPPPNAPPELQRAGPDISKVVFTTKIGGRKSMGIYAETVAAADFWTTDADVWARARVVDATGRTIGEDEETRGHHTWYLATPTVAAIARYRVFSECGLGNDGRGRWSAWLHVGSSKWGLVEFGDDDWAELPSCNCENAQFADPDYAADSTDCQDASAASGDGELGRKMEPGQKTNGETVNWHTGQLDGGTSVCGAAAVVDYVCIWYWDGATRRIWGCGYVTTC